MARVNTRPETFSPRPSLLTRVLLAASRRTTGFDLDTVAAMAHRPGVLVPWSLLEAATMRTRSVLPDHLADLVVFVVARRLGCPWCVDFSAALWQRAGLDSDVLRAAADWRENSGTFDDTTLAAFAFAEALSDDPTRVDDDLVERLRDAVGESGLVEVAYWAALENMRSRFNASLGLTSQGFSDTCELPSSALPQQVRSTQA